MRLFYQIRAAFRILLVALAIGIGALIVLLLSLLPIRVHGAKLATWPVVFMARAFMGLMGIRYHCPDPERIRNHQGLLFCNHTSFLDILMILYLTPARFLSTKGVRKLPVIGQLAVALDTVFVHRYNEAARAAARDEIVAQLRERTYPPLAIFPEGKIGPGHTVLPLRYGAFEIAKAEGISILPCAIVYDALDVVTWYERADSLIELAWQLGQQRQISAKLIPLDLIYPQPGDDIPRLAE
ncbi:MAG: 1-acyl-sn-glycerol-3-phosphate acyltransferase [Caldilineaceae bacterium]|nr:1-acyl-sn-glycerol-3-phosphate acyltransferase [Caldilineaceae bacterium]